MYFEQLHVNEYANETALKRCTATDITITIIIIIIIIITIMSTWYIHSEYEITYYYYVLIRLYDMRSVDVACYVVLFT